MWVFSKSSLAERFSAEFSNLNLVEVLAEFSLPSSLREHMDSLSSRCQLVNVILLLLIGRTADVLSIVAVCTCNPFILGMYQISGSSWPDMRSFFNCPILTNMSNRTGYCNRIFYSLNEYCRRKIYLFSCNYAMVFITIYNS